MPRCVMAAGSPPVLFSTPILPYIVSSGSSGVGRGEGKCRFVRSGSDPPVLRFPWKCERPALGSEDGKTLKRQNQKYKCYDPLVA